MKNIFTALAAFALITTGTLSAQAQSGNSSLRALLGFTSSAVNLGVDFEMKQSRLYGFGGYIFMGSDQNDAGKTVVPGVLAVGGFAPIHVLNDEMVDVYVAPGFGIAKIDHPRDDNTTFGPSLKIGAEFAVAPTVKLGLQYFVITNWLEDEETDQVSYTSAAATFSF
jgi:hypothetical protein